MSLIKLLWADDDADAHLELLMDDMREAKLNVQVVRDFETAERELRSRERASVFLVDAILPDLRPTASMNAFHGIRLAQRSLADRLFQRVAVLSVVSQSRLRTELAELEKLSGLSNIPFRFFDKTQLFEPNAIEDLLAFLGHAQRGEQP